jgi:hypothetical protein
VSAPKIRPETQIERIRVRAEDKARDDDILKELVRLQKLREEQVAAFQKGLGAQLAKMGENHRELAALKLQLEDQGMESQAKLAEARIQVAQRRDAIAREVGGAALEKLNAEMIMLEVDIAELHGLREHTAQKLAEIERPVEEMEKKMQELQRKLEAARPWKITVVSMGIVDQKDQKE